jgi:hypothetical protein
MAVLRPDLVYEAHMRHTFGLTLAAAALLGCAESTPDAATLANYTPTHLTTHPSGARAIAAEPDAPEPADVLKEDLVVGDGAEARSGDKIKVHYAGWLRSTGAMFDTSRKAGRGPFEIQLGVGQVIEGWDRGLLGMKAGGKRKLTIPPRYGYGEKGAPPSIPPRATLVFEIELLDVAPAHP